MCAINRWYVHNPRVSHKIIWFEQAEFWKGKSGAYFRGRFGSKMIRQTIADWSGTSHDFFGRSKNCTVVGFSSTKLYSLGKLTLPYPYKKLPWYDLICVSSMRRWQCYSPRRKLSVLGLTWRINAPLIWWKDFFHSSFSLRIRPQCSCLKQVRCFGYFWIKSGMSKELWIKTCVFGSTFFSSGSTSDWFHSWGLLIWGHHFFSIHSFWGVLGL